MSSGSVSFRRTRISAVSSLRSNPVTMYSSSRTVPRLKMLFRLPTMRSRPAANSPTFRGACQSASDAVASVNDVPMPSGCVKTADSSFSPSTRLIDTRDSRTGILPVVKNCSSALRMSAFRRSISMRTVACSRSEAACDARFTSSTMRVASSITWRA